MRALLTLIALLLLAGSAFAQGHRLDNGGLATEVIVFNQDGTTATFASGSGAATEATLASMASDIATLAANPSIDANNDEAARSSGPQTMCYASTTTPTVVTAADAARVWCDLSGGLVLAGSVADDAAFTPATSRVFVFAGEADEATTDSVDEGDAGALRITLDRKLITTPQPHTAGGLLISRNISVVNGSGTAISGAHQLYSMWVTNTATATRFIKIYDATSCTMGTGTPVITIGIAGNASDDVVGQLTGGGYGIAFATGICYGATTAVADADTGAPSANDVIVNAFYK